MHKVFIADNSEDFSQILAGALRSSCQVETCADGAQALTMIRASRPDVLILDLMLPNMPGMELLRTVREENLCQAVIVTGRFFSDYVMERLRRYSVDSAVMKPCSIQSIVDQVEDLRSSIHPGALQQPDPHCVVSSMLLALNMSTNKKGFRYSREAILLMADEPNAQVTKTIYPEVAKRFNASSDSAVEKAIRTAINAAWKNRDDRVWRRYFPPAPNGQIPRPTNAVFLARLADAVATDRRAVNGWY